MKDKYNHEKMNEYKRNNPIFFGGIKTQPQEKNK